MNSGHGADRASIVEGRDPHVMSLRNSGHTFDFRQAVQPQVRPHDVYRPPARRLWNAAISVMCRPRPIGIVDSSTILASASCVVTHRRLVEPDGMRSLQSDCDARRVSRCHRARRVENPFGRSARQTLHVRVVLSHQVNVSAKWNHSVTDGSSGGEGLNPLTFSRVRVTARIRRRLHLPDDRAGGP